MAGKAPGFTWDFMTVLRETILQCPGCQAAARHTHTRLPVRVQLGSNLGSRWRVHEFSLRCRPRIYILVYNLAGKSCSFYSASPPLPIFLTSCWGICPKKKHSSKKRFPLLRVQNPSSSPLAILCNLASHLIRATSFLSGSSLIS